MFPPVYRTLIADSTVLGIVGNRIYSHGEAPQDTSKPYVTWESVSGVPEICLSGLPDIDRWQLVFNCFSSTGPGVIALANAVRNVIETVGYVTNVPFDGRDEETRLFWIAIEMDWLFVRTP